MFATGQFRHGDAAKKVSNETALSSVRALFVCTSCMDCLPLPLPAWYLLPATKLPIKRTELPVHTFCLSHFPHQTLFISVDHMDEDFILDRQQTLSMLLENPWISSLLSLGPILCNICTLMLKDRCRPPPNLLPFANRSNELQFNDETIPLSVNYHFTRRCNYVFGFCFHTISNTQVTPLNDAKASLLLLAKETMKKIFAGGEPFRPQSMLGKMVDCFQQQLKLEGVRSVTRSMSTSAPTVIGSSNV